MKTKLSTRLYHLWCFALLACVPILSHGEQAYSNIQSIAYAQVASTGNGALTGCNFASNIAWEGANDLLSAAPGIGTLIKVGIAFSKIGNNVACNKLDSPQSMLKFMAEEAARIADAKVDDALTTQLTNEGDDLLQQLSRVGILLKNYDSLTNSEKNSLADRLNSIGNSASQLEAAGMGLSFIALHPLTIISSVKTSAFMAEYSIREEGILKSELKNTIREESAQSVDIFETKENQFTSHLSKYAIHNLSFYENPNDDECTSSWDADCDYHVEFYVTDPSGDDIWHKTWHCERVLQWVWWAFAFRYSSNCGEYNAIYSQYQQEADVAMSNAKHNARKDMINMDVAGIKTKIMMLATDSKPQNSWMYIMSATATHRCLDTSSNTTNGRRAVMWDCGLSNRNQNWVLDDSGYLRSATQFAKCLEPSALSSGSAVRMWDCDTSQTKQTWERYGDNSLRPKDAPNLCLDIYDNNGNNGAQLIIYNCHGGNNQQWYWYTHLQNGLGKCMDTSGTTADGAAILLYECGVANQNQLWAIDQSNRIRSFTNPNACLGLAGSSLATGTEIQNWTCQDNYQLHQWAVLEDGTVRPSGDYSMCMDLANDSNSNETRIVLNHCEKGRDAQRWAPILNDIRATVFQHSNYDGYFVPLAEGDYTLDALILKGMKDNDISSLQLDEGYVAYLYEGDYFSGAEHVVTQDTTLFSGFNDRISSIRIRNVDDTVAPGLEIGGTYENHLYDNGGKNNWHYVEITRLDTDTYLWTNSAGVSWTLYATNDPLVLAVGADCPYYSQGYTQAKLTVANSKVVSIIGPGNEPYLKEN